MPERAAFDVVVVGGGAAGCVVAARLAQSGTRSVLLIEAGPDRRADLPDELRNGWTIERDLFDWGYTSDGGAAVRRKRIIGGTGWLTRFTPRGGPADFDEWVSMGNAGWGFDDVLPHFKRLETDLDFGERPWHGDRGPIPSSRYLHHEYAEITAASLDALCALGVPWIDDHNEPGAVGVGRMPMNSIDGVRVTTADAYLPLGSTPSNLTIRAGAEVAAVTFDGNRANGVRLVDDAEIAAGCVVLCAGTYGSPPILMRSGIGPAEHLRAVGVPVLRDLPGVGANLADHPGLDIDFGYSAPPRAAGPVLHAIATFHSSGRPTDKPPDLMFWLSDPEGEPPAAAIGVVLLKPLSRGSVRLRSSEATDAPLIELPALHEAADIERLAEGYRRALELANRPELRALCTGAAPTVPRNDAELHDRIRAEAFSVPHVVGTCAMGPRPDDGAVVDASGRVHGVDGLYIVDASIMPTVPSGFTHVPTIMIAERLAEQIA